MNAVFHRLEIRGLVGEGEARGGSVDHDVPGLRPPRCRLAPGGPGPSLRGTGCVNEHRSNDLASVSTRTNCACSPRE
jgi:hypothetical protein